MNVAERSPPLAKQRWAARFSASPGFMHVTRIALARGSPSAKDRLRPENARGSAVRCATLRAVGRCATLIASRGRETDRPLDGPAPETPILKFVLVS
jgi:hypothetical protein